MSSENWKVRNDCPIFLKYPLQDRIHDYSILLIFVDIDIGKLANGFGLIRLPKMPELKKMSSDSFTPSDIDIDSIPYLDKQREKQRQLKLKQGKQEGATNTPSNRTDRFKNDQSWSKSKEKKIKKEKRKARKENLKRKREETEFDEDDLYELSREVNLMKKLRRGKISKEQFQKAVKDDYDDLEI